MHYLRPPLPQPQSRKGEGQEGFRHWTAPQPAEKCPGFLQAPAPKVKTFFGKMEMCWIISGDGLDSHPAQTAELQGAVRRGRGSPRPVTASASRLQQPHHRALQQCWEHLREKGFQRGQHSASSEGGIVRNSPEVRAEGAPGLGLLWPEVSPCWSRGRRAERSCPRLITALILILLLCLGYREGKGAGSEVEPGKKQSPPFF